MLHVITRGFESHAKQTLLAGFKLNILFFLGSNFYATIKTGKRKLRHDQSTGHPKKTLS